jgi:putative tricarboxylic transport membrane protein
MTDQTNDDSGGKYGPIKSTQDLAGGLFLIFVACFALYHGWKLPMGTLRSMGPGMLPISLAFMVMAGGVALVVLSVVGKSGENMTRWSWRGMFFIVLSIMVFALTIQRFGLIVAGPASMLVAMLAAEDMKWVEGVIFAVGMTLLCGLMFKTLLGLPIPVNNLW